MKKLFNEKALPLLLTAVQAVSDVKKTLDNKIQGLVKETLNKYDSELQEVKSRLAKIEGGIENIISPVQKKKAPVARKPRASKKSDSARGCSMPGCQNKHMARGLCKNHYYQFKRGTIVKTAEGFSSAKGSSSEGSSGSEGESA